MNLACCLAAASLGGAQPAAAAGAAVAATVEQPRSFGHVLGDVLVQRVLLARDGHSVEPTALPAADRVSLYLDRRATRIEQDEGDRRWLVIEYQVVNVPRALTAVSVPAWSVATATGPLQVAAWPISIAPLTPDATFDQGALQPLRPDRPVMPQPTEALERQLKGTLAVLAALLLAWGVWWAWRNAREAHRLPFARAWQQLRRVDPSSAEAWRVLHHALNATAGRVVHGRTLPALLADAPHLQPLAPRLEAFYRLSEQRFFAAAAGIAAAELSLRDLALALREAERTQHG
jgi:mxaA protein